MCPIENVTMDPGFRARFRQFLERQGPLDDIFNDGAVILSVAKNNETSTKYRNKGNRKYKRNNEDASLAALTAYNKSICFATSGSEELAMAYANRSAVYLTLHEYDKCLENIELARTNGALSPALAEKLQRREVECNQLLQAIVVNTCQWPVTPSLSHPSNPNIPFVSSCLEVRSDPKYGRHVITNRDLAVGDIVAIESPFCTIVPKAKLYERCEHCYRENSMSLIPCNGCTAVMFCSQRCRDEAHTQYHRFECPIIDYIHSSMEDRVDLLPMRMTVCAIMSFASTDELLTFLTEARGVDNNVFRCNLAAEIDGKQRYGPVYAMQSAKPGEMVDESVCWQRLASILFAMVEMSPLHEYLTDETMAPLVDLLKHHMLVAPINASSTWDMTDDCETEPETVIAGIYPFRSLLSHSCAPNIWTTACGNKVIVSIIRTTNAGDQLFDSYG